MLAFATRAQSPLLFIVLFTQIMLLLASGALPAGWESSPETVPSQLLSGCLHITDFQVGIIQILFRAAAAH